MIDNFVVQWATEETPIGFMVIGNIPQNSIAH